jgi:hypothetical protein
MNSRHLVCKHLAVPHHACLGQIRTQSAEAPRSLWGPCEQVGGVPGHCPRGPTHGSNARHGRAFLYRKTAHRTGLCCRADTPPASSSAESGNRLTTKAPRWFVISLDAHVHHDGSGDQIMAPARAILSPAPSRPASLNWSALERVCNC